MSPFCRHFSLLLLLHLIPMSQSYLKAPYNPDPKVLHDISVLPHFSSDDVLEVYHLRSAPLPLVQTSIGDFTAQSSALAIRSTLTTETLVFQFHPVNVSSCFLPFIADEPLPSNEPQRSGGTTGRKRKLYWDKRSQISYDDSIDMNFWQQSTYLVDINGIVFDGFVSWLGDYLKQVNSFWFTYAISMF